MCQMFYEISKSIQNSLQKILKRAVQEPKGNKHKNEFWDYDILGQKYCYYLFNLINEGISYGSLLSVLASKTGYLPSWFII